MDAPGPSGTLHARPFQKALLLVIGQPCDLKGPRTIALRFPKGQGFGTFCNAEARLPMRIVPASVIYRCCRGLLQRYLCLSSGRVLRDAQSQLGSARDGDGVLPDRLRKAAVFRRLQVPGDLPPQVLAVRNRMLRS